jgi:hypothetical protein
VPVSPTSRPFVRGLRDNLVSLLGGSVSPAGVSAIVMLSHAVAEGALRRRGHLQYLVARHGISQSDLAYDCIGDMLARDEQGRYRSLESYFSAFSLVDSTDEEAFFHLQRLVYTKVRNGIFRMYQEMDPQLGRILHNVKSGNRALGHFIAVDRLGDSCFQPALSESLEHLPVVEVNDLAGWLSQEATGSQFIPELLGKIALILKRQKERSRIVPIVTIGLAIRQFCEALQVPRLEEAQTSIDEGAVDARSVISSTVEELNRTFKSRYVGKGKVTATFFEGYCRVITEMLRLRFVERDGLDFEIGAGFMALFPRMSKEEYRKKHKNKIEYLARIASENAARKLMLE